MHMKKSLSRYLLSALVVLSTSTATIVYAADEPAGQGASAYLSDAAITTKVKSALLTSKLTGISVKTELGVVALSGSVPSEEVRQQATKIASSIDGVRGVDYTGLSVKMGS